MMQNAHSLVLTPELGLAAAGAMLAGPRATFHAASTHLPAVGKVGKLRSWCHGAGLPNISQHFP